MPLNTAQVTQLATSTAFVERVRAVSTLVALTIRREPIATPKHDQRTAMAKIVLESPDMMTRRIVMVALTLNTLDSMDISDAQLYNAINSQWNDMID